jgi:chemotaxis protein methyltransferase CheR
VTCQVSPRDVERFRSAVIRQIGLRFDDTRLGFLGEVLQRRLEKLARGSGAYLWDLESAPASGELSALARELTVGETYFFRNNEQFRALAEVVLPERMRVQQASRTLRVLSAGCASGEEAYSLAIVARETLPDDSWKLSIRAVDLNPGALEKATRARYSPWSLRGTPPHIQAKWFHHDGRDVVLDDLVRSSVTIESGNLADNDPDLWQPASYDAIFCRNVLMYFAPEQMGAAVARIAQSLVPGGFLFLGHAETLRGVSDAFHLRHTHNTFYYQLETRDDGTRLPTIELAPRTWAPRSAGRSLDTAWVETIRAASERVAMLVAPPAVQPTTSECPTSAFDPGPALELLRQEKFAEALDHVRANKPATGRDRDALLLEATLLAHRGELDAAEDVAQRLLILDQLNAGAHYVLALCRERAGQTDRAREHDRVAAYLDPAFAMPRLHLGLLARRGGDADDARREFAYALHLLRREHVSRLLLFGGGFNRNALVALCESALRECGGRP